MKLTPKEMENYRRFHIPGCGNLNRIKVNAVFFRGQNSREHELKKAEICYDIISRGEKFITESERNMKRGEARVIVDIVNLSTGEETELETSKFRAKGLVKENKSNVVMVKR